jgi:hypothetical protein
MKILEISLHQIDHVNSVIQPLSIPKDNDDLITYLKELIIKISETDGKRQFIFESDTTEVKKLIDNIIEGSDFKSATAKIADRLMRKEQNAQSDIEHLKHEIQKGILIQAKLEINASYKVIIAKADHTEYLDDQNLRNRKGLPVKRKLYKALMMDFDRKGSIENIYVYDTNLNIARYWWSDFLELQELNTDEHNTTMAFDYIAQRLLGKLKNEFPADHNIIRNRVLGYFRSNRDFEIKHFVKHVVGNYEPVNESLDVEKLKEKIYSLPEKKGFDAQFSIKSEVIKARKLRSIVELNDKMDLHIKEYMPNIQRIIEPIIIKGEKYIRIKTEAGYEAFKTAEE